jgi:hypothetical protein
MSNPAVQKYFEKKRLVYRRQVDRVMAEARVRYLEQQFRGTVRLLEPLKWESLEMQLGDAYKELMKLRKVKMKP